MSEADAEDGLHGLDEPLAITNDTRLNIEFVSDCFFLRRSPTEPPSAHSIQKCIPPRKRKSMERRKRGEGGAPSPRGEWQRSSNHAIGAYERISSYHSRGACEVSRSFC